MSTVHNVFTIEFLRDHPGDFIIGCQSLIEFSVRRYLRTRMFSMSEKSDIIQSINEQLLGKVPAIIENYNGDADLRTYMGAVIQNICLKIHRDRINEISFLPLKENDAVLYESPETQLLIKEEIERFHVIMILLYRERTKFLLCSKIIFKIAVTEQDIRRALPSIDLSETQKLLKAADLNNRPDNSEEIFGTFADVFSRCGKKRIDGDSLRRWTRRNIEHVLNLLNGDPPQYSHSVDSLKALVEEYTESEYYTT